MRSSLITLLFFLLGGVVGAYASVSVDTHRASVYVLYLLMLLLGISLGCSRDPKQIVASLRPDALLLPLATVGGTLLFSAMGGFLLSRWTAFDCMAVGSGFAYYSVSSILITEIKSASLGVQVATELGTIALLSNIFREMAALLCAPLFRRYFGYLAPISAAGIGYLVARHSPLFRSGRHSVSHHSRTAHRNQHAVLRLPVLPVVICSLYFGYYAGETLCLFPVHEGRGEGC